MKVSELIEALSKLDPDLNVIYHGESDQEGQSIEYTVSNVEEILITWRERVVSISGEIR